MMIGHFNLRHGDIESIFTMEKDMNVRKPGEVNQDVLKTVHITQELSLEVLKCVEADHSQDPIKCILGHGGGQGINCGALAEIFGTTD